ncbi:MAG: hypothetical protein ACK5JL_02770 [Candidatus Kapaibacterium sp.]|jgi:hypothetical protein
MPNPPTVDELTYEGISLGIGQKRKVSLETMLTPDGRQTQYHRIQIEVDAIVSPTVTSPNGTATELRAKLTRNGGRLKATNIGLGFDLDVGGSASVKDVLGGPFPRLLHFQPLGAQDYTSAIEVHWVVELNVLFNESEGITSDEIAAFTYAQSYSIDNGGWTTRTTNGTLVVRKEFVSPNRIAHNADSHRDEIKIVKPIGYERRQQYSLSEDKATLTFSIVDTQIKTRNPYPPGVVEIEATHAVSKTLSQMATTQHRISVRVEIAADQPTIYAWFVAQQVILKRIFFARQQGLDTLIESIEVEEEIFGLALHVSVAYRTLNDVDEWLAKSGIFQPVELRWDPWEVSMHHIEEPRGISNLTPDPIAQDLLVNMNYPSLPVIRDEHDYHIDPTVTQPEHLCNPLPPPENSWAHFEASIDLYQYGVERDHWVPTGPEAIEDGVVSFNELKKLGRDTRAEIPAILAKNPGYANTLVYRGTAIRVGYDIPMPKLVVPGAKLSCIDKSFKPTCLGIFYCQPVYAAKWEILYQLQDLPASMDTSRKTDGSGYGGTLSSGTGGTGTPPQTPNVP